LRPKEPVIAGTSLRCRELITIGLFKIAKSIELGTERMTLLPVDVSLVFGQPMPAREFEKRLMPVSTPFRELTGAYISTRTRRQCIRRRRYSHAGATRVLQTSPRTNARARPLNGRQRGSRTGSDHNVFSRVDDATMCGSTRLALPDTTSTPGTRHALFRRARLQPILAGCQRISF
jgi:hypothetical protein